MAAITELYESGIEKLQAYVDGEPDQVKRDAATAKIHQLRVAMQDALFYDMTQRSIRLQELRTALQEISDEAGDGSGLSGAIAAIGAFLEEIPLA
jgi:hypothetical protein